MDKKDIEEMQWEYEADQEWDAFYKSYGIDRSELIRQMTTPIYRSFSHRIKGYLWNVYYAICPPKNWR
jgi:hypothetical protein